MFIHTVSASGQLWDPQAGCDPAGRSRSVGSCPLQVAHDYLHPLLQLECARRTVMKMTGRRQDPDRPAGYGEDTMGTEHLCLAPSSWSRQQGSWRGVSWRAGGPQSRLPRPDQGHRAALQQGPGGSWWGPAETLGVGPETITAPSGSYFLKSWQKGHLFRFMENFSCFQQSR